MDVSRIETVPPPAPDLRHIALAIVLALAGGFLGVVGALFVEVRSGLGPLLPIVGAPIAEEILKPSGVYFLLARWPRVLQSQLEIALLSALSGLVFGLLESLTYVTLYAPHHSHAYLVFRFTVPVALHVVASFTAGLGINRQLLDWASRGTKFPKSSRNAFLAAIAMHATYNIIAVVLVLTSVLNFS